jgi:hypothetical protein
MRPPQKRGRRRTLVNHRAIASIALRNGMVVSAAIELLSRLR